jgi:hypothetical protein
VPSLLKPPERYAAFEFGDEASNVVLLRHPDEIHDSYVLRLLEHDHVAVTGTRADMSKQRATMLRSRRRATIGIAFDYPI